MKSRWLSKKNAESTIPVNERRPCHYSRLLLQVPGVASGVRKQSTGGSYLDVSAHTIKQIRGHSCGADEKAVRSVLTGLAKSNISRI